MPHSPCTCIAQEATQPQERVSHEFPNTIKAHRTRGQPTKPLALLAVKVSCHTSRDPCTTQKARGNIDKAHAQCTNRAAASTLPQMLPVACTHNLKTCWLVGAPLFLQPRKLETYNRKPQDQRVPSLSMAWSFLNFNPFLSFLLSINKGHVKITVRCSSRMAAWAVRKKPTQKHTAN